MKKVRSVVSLILIICFCFSTVAFAEEVKLSGEKKIINSNLSSVSADMIEGIISSNENSRKVLTEENAKNNDMMLEQLSMLYLSAEEIEAECKVNPTTTLTEALSLIRAYIVDLEKAIEDNGAIKLDTEQVNAIFSEGNKINNGSVTKPNDTKNTRYYLYGPYTISTDEGDCTYVYITATCLSTSSNMSESEYIPMNEDKVSKYIGAVVDVYVGKAAGGVIGSLAWWTDFIPYELLLDPPSSHYQSTATYSINARYTTNNKFIMCYSPTMQEYFLGIVLNSTSIREVHDNQYVYNGVSKGSVEEKSYTVDCDNWSSISSVTREYWESYEDLHLEYVDEIEYNYEDDYVTSITPPHAYAFWNLN